jgi:acetyltransferase-like isoleucine patch superfamily enzyme
VTPKDAWAPGPLPGNVRVGTEVTLEQQRGTFKRFNSNRNPALVVGDRTRIHAWTNFSVEENGAVEIGQDCVVIGAIFMCAERIVLGDRVVVSLRTLIADCDFHPLDPELRRRDAIACAPEGDPSERPPYETKPVVIGDDVQIGVGAIVLKGVQVGAGARIGAGAVVTADVPAGAAVEGNPARVVG